MANVVSAQIDCDERQREAVPIEVRGDEEKKLPLTLEPPTKKENILISGGVFSQVVHTCICVMLRIEWTPDTPQRAITTATPFQWKNGPS